MDRTTVRPIAAEAPELARDAWSSFDDADPDMPELCRRTLLAEAEVLRNALWIAALWDDDRLRGVAVAIEESRGTGTRVLVAGMHFGIRLGQCAGLWIARHEDRGAVARALLEALREHARANQLAHVIVGFVPAADVALRDAGAALGARAVDAPPEYQLELAAGTRFDAFLAGLGYSARRHWKRDLAACAKAGVELTQTRTPSATQLARAWAMQEDTMRRKGTTLACDGDLFAAFARHFDAGVQTLTLCSRGDRLLGFVTMHLTPAIGCVMGVGHVDGEEFQVLQAVMSQAIRDAIDGGVRAVLLGSTSDTYKQRMGCTATSSVHLVLRA